MSALGKRMPVELFTATWRVTGAINTNHIHIRDELNDTRRSVLVFREIEVADLNDMRAPRVTGNESWIDKSTVLFAVPQKIRGATSTLAQRTIQSRLGKNEHRLLLSLPSWRIIGHLYFVGRFQIEDALRRDSAAFGSLSNVEMTFLPDPSISFVADELAFNIHQVSMLCSQFDID